MGQEGSSVLPPAPFSFYRRPSLKQCIKCNELKEDDDFYLVRIGGTRRHGSCKSCAKAYAAKWFRDHRQRSYGNSRRFIARQRLTVLTHYSGGTPRCACCGEVELKFLAIDHIDGGGRAHRAKHRSPGSYFKWFRDNNYPAGFQVLCHNCNCAKGFYGSCPHTEKP